jgi:hypothetical protein
MKDVTDIPNDVVFRCEGILYTSTALVRLDTQDPHHPAIFVTRDRGKAFLTTVSPVGTLSIKSLSKLEFQELLRHYQLADRAPK